MQAKGENYMKKINVHPLSGLDAVFLPGNIHGCDWQAYIIYYNDQADEGFGCWEIEIIDKDRILKLYHEVEGDADAFWDILPDLYHGEWYYCDQRSRPEEFSSYKDSFETADFIAGRDGDSFAEMNFLVEWAAA